MRIEPRRDGDRITIGPQSTSFGREVELVNPSERSWTKHRFILWFGCIGTTRLMVWSNSLEDAIEEAADYLARFTPGHVMKHGSPEHIDLIKEQCEEAGVGYPNPFYDLDDEEKYKIYEAAEADLTYTESGFLTSYEWGIDMEDPTRKQLDEFLYPPDLDWSKERSVQQSDL